jgi:capsular polysaccharide biosynthesis protein
VLAFLVLATTIIGYGIWSVATPSTDKYQATALIVPVRLRASGFNVVDVMGDRVFENGAVESVVRDNLDLDARTNLVPEHIDLVLEEGDPVPALTVAARHGDEHMAEHMANVAAAAFVRELNSLEWLGTFTIQSAADESARPVDSTDYRHLLDIAGLVTILVAFCVAAYRVILKERRENVWLC